MSFLIICIFNNYVLVEGPKAFSRFMPFCVRSRFGSSFFVFAFSLRHRAGDVALQRPSLCIGAGSAPRCPARRPRCCRPCKLEPRSFRALDPGNQVVCWERATLTPCVGIIAAPASLASLTGVAVPCHRAGRGHLRLCHKASSTSGPDVSYVRCGAMPSRRVRSPVVLPSALPAAPASLTFLTSDAAPCPGAGGGRLRYCHLRVRKGPAAPASLTSLTSDAEPCHRTGCECGRCCH